MATQPPTLRLDPDQALAVRLAAQGLLTPGSDVTTVLEDHGFVRTLGGVDVYLAVRARMPALRRENLDEAVAAGDAQIVPAVRGCMYLVPRRHVPLALRVADILSRRRFEREEEKAGIRPGELEDVGTAVEAALAGGPLTTTALRSALPDGMVRSLGEAGKKLGISSPLPPALRRLEFAGRVQRTPDGGRLDTERYLWALPARSPFDGADLPDEPADLYARLAAIFLRAAGLATLDSFAAWAGLSKRDARAALEANAPLTAAVEGDETPYFLPESLRSVAQGAGDARAMPPALLPFEDNLVALHGGAAIFVDPAHHATPVPVWGHTKGTTLGDARHMSLRSVVAEGRIVGFWEFDPDAAKVVVACFAPVTGATRKALDETAEALGGFLAEQIGHGRSFSLDTDDKLRQRSALLAKGF